MVTSYYSKEELNELGFASIGDDVLISRKASIYGCSNMKIGNHVRIDDFAILSGTIIIGNYVHIAAAVSLFAGNYGIYLEDFAGISSHCSVYAVTDDYSGKALTNPTVPDELRNILGGKVCIKKHAIIGTGTSILPGVTVGEGVSVGSMSLVNKSLDAWGIYVGVPCRKIKERSKELLVIESKLTN